MRNRGRFLIIGAAMSLAAFVPSVGGGAPSPAAAESAGAAR
jgi:hypothetical protein